MTIRVLPPNLINQIAAGEVVERPASAIKELVENAIDAGADKIDVTIDKGGKSYFAVTDNGYGMTRDELELAIQRHATSKLPSDDLLDINFVGFRGEALPSIASVAKMKLISRKADMDSGWQLLVEGGKAQSPTPVPCKIGTTIEVRDLFYATPARLKFLKSEQSEQSAIREVLDRLAMSHPEITFTLNNENRKLAFYPATNNLFDRVAMVIGHEFKDNALSVQTQYEDLELSGFIGLPTYTRPTSTEQYLFVNGRSVKDKILLGAIRGAYQGLMGHGSDGHPVLALFLSVPKHSVDVNVSPAKTEVRFADSARIRGMLVASLRNTLAEHGNKTATTLNIGALDTTPQLQKAPYRPTTTSKNPSYYSAPVQHTLQMNDSYQVKAYENTKIAPAIKETPVSDDFPPLGFAKAQIHKTYIVSQTQDGIVIVDQHAAHERLTYEKMMAQIGEHPQTQLLLMPEIVDLKLEEVALLNTRAQELKDMGWVLDAFGTDSIAVREIPALLDKTDIKKTIQDLVDTLKTFDDTILLKDKMKDICARIACHGSVRAGRVLSIDEMNALLRQMEACGTSGQCIHGRPTYIELQLKDIEKLFNR
ncbi:MAG: DNA mismatch repair endonuclease MutL [Alphaproteobacteria bacterium]|nr:DNA mismatch repair endonuclease MutL [Alphaproteobacteria bacterium]